jgi:hypothetical protein
MTVSSDISHKTFDFDEIERKTGMKAHNSSIIRINDGGYLLLSRLSNFTNCSRMDTLLRGIDDVKQKFYEDQCQRSRSEKLVVSVLDKNLSVRSTRVLDTTFDCSNIHDIRCFEYRGEVFLMGTIEFYEPRRIAQALCRLSDMDWMILTVRDSSSTVYKNWCPVVVFDELFFVHQHNPLTILRPDLKTGVCDVVYEGEAMEDLPQGLRGSSPYLDIGDGKYLGVTHSMTGSSTLGKTYTHYFTILDMLDGPSIKKVSKSLCLSGDCGIEFVMGITESCDKSSYVVSYGKDDCSSNVIAIPKMKLRSYFE